MKYLAMNTEKFKYKWTAMFSANLQVISTMIIEALNIWNCALQPNILELIMNYIALGVLASFDDEFFKQFQKTKLGELIKAEIDIEIHCKDKLYITQENYTEIQEKLERQAKNESYVNFRKNFPDSFVSDDITKRINRKFLNSKAETYRVSPPFISKLSISLVG